MRTIDEHDSIDATPPSVEANIRIRKQLVDVETGLSHSVFSVTMYHQDT